MRKGLKIYSCAQMRGVPTPVLNANPRPKSPPKT